MVLSPYSSLKDPSEKPGDLASERILITKQRQQNIVHVDHRVLHKGHCCQRWARETISSIEHVEIFAYVLCDICTMILLHHEESQILPHHSTTYACV